MFPSKKPDPGSPTATEEEPAPLPHHVERRKSITHIPKPTVHPELAINDHTDDKVAIPVREALGQRRGSIKDAQEAREKVRRASSESAKRSLKGSNSQLRALLSKHTVADLKCPSKVVEIDGSLKPEEGFEILLKANILSAPVWDKDSKSYLGFLDVRDLVASIVNIHQTHNQKVSSLLTVAVKGLEQKEDEPPSLTYLARRNQFKPVSANSNLLDVANVLKNRSIHRVPVMNNEGKCVQIISQSSILQFIANYRDALADDMKQPLEEINLGFNDVVTVGSHEKAFAAFKTIDKTQFSGIGVVDSHGKLIGNTSAKDIKYLVLDKGELSLEMPVLEYLSAIRQRVITASEKAPICVVHKDATFGRVIGLLAATQFHRLFIVDGKGCAIGVVSITDILNYATH